MQMDRPLKIATAKDRFTKKWTNREVSWGELCKRLGQSVRTAETAADYRGMGHAKQDTIKDVGGFVGGSLTEGLRLSGHLGVRSLITLDLDDIHTNETKFLDGFITMNDFECYIYSTHKHTPEKPRLRLIIPLTRDVSGDEYGAIAHRIAYDAGILEQCDDTTYQATRLMYWPSEPKDIKEVSRRIEGDWLDPDKLLAEYTDWKDVSSWPVSSRIKEQPRKIKEKAEDPTTKPGAVGAFCRAYSISAAIAKFLPEVYTPVTEGQRYTYAGGSTAGGLVVYDDLFAYSNHATDPSSMQLCNAWDLVRIHKFGEQDLDAKPDTPIGSMPSSKAMLDFALKDEDFRQQRAVDQVQSATEDFAGIDPAAAAEPVNLDWMKKLTQDKRGIECTRKNFRTIITNDPNLVNCGRYNEFTRCDEVSGPLPWDKRAGARQWTDTDDAGLQDYIESVYKLDGKDKCRQAADLVHHERSYHPVRDYLNGLKWDGIERLDTCLIDYLGAEDTPYTRAVTRKMVVAAVKRIYHPGCKMDYMLVLRGPQGSYKSTFVRRLSEPWYSDSIFTVSGKDAYDCLQGVWMMEIAELTATRKADVEATKQFISKQSDTYRQAYDRRTNTFPRMCVFWGTTNDYNFLRDATGNRRYWPVDIDKDRASLSIDKLTDDIVKQLHAEAIERMKAGETLYLNAELEKVAMEQQAEHSEHDAKEGPIIEYLNTLMPADWGGMTIKQRYNWLHGIEDFAADPHKNGTEYRLKVCALEILCECFGYEKRSVTRQDVREINDILQNLHGWKREVSGIRFGDEYGNQRGFTRTLETAKQQYDEILSQKVPF
jgi:putative DNA primase/helicase